MIVLLDKAWGWSLFGVLLKGYSVSWNSWLVFRFVYTFCETCACNTCIPNCRVVAVDYVITSVEQRHVERHIVLLQWCWCVACIALPSLKFCDVLHTIVRHYVTHWRIQPGCGVAGVQKLFDVLRHWLNERTAVWDVRPRIQEKPGKKRSPLSVISCRQFQNCVRFTM